MASQKNRQKREYFGGDLFVKDIKFRDTEMARNPNLFEKFFTSKVAQRNQTATQMIVAHLLHVRFGAQLWVTKEVSDDLLLTSVDDPTDFPMLEWPHHRLELFFEDPDIPSMLVEDIFGHQYAVELSRLMGKNPEELPRNTFYPIKRLVSFHVMRKDGHNSCITFPPDEFACKIKEVEEMDEEGIRLAEKEAASNPYLGDLARVASLKEYKALSRLQLLFYKILLYCNSEGTYVRKTNQQPTKSQGGKAGFKNRPTVPRLIVEYLPRQRQEREKQAREYIADKKREFRGRRGHWRTYRHERYKAAAGKRQFIYPIPGPDGEVPRRKFVVVKHKN